MFHKHWRRLLAQPAAAPPAAPPAAAQPKAPAQPALRAKSAMQLVAEHAEQLREELRQVERRDYEDHKASIADADARMAAAMKWVERTGLKYAIPRIIEDVAHWHAWIGRDDFLRWVPNDVFDIAAVSRQEAFEGRKEPAQGFRVDFCLMPGAPRYGFEFVQHAHGFEGTYFGETRVYEGDIRVFTIECMTDDAAGEWGPRWKTWQPSLLVPGDWVMAILALEHRLRMHRNRTSQDSNAAMLEARAAGLPAPEALN